MIIAVDLMKDVTKNETQWCGCCGCLLSKDREIIRIQIFEENDAVSRIILKEHLLDWLNSEEATYFTFQHKRRIENK